MLPGFGALQCIDQFLCYLMCELRRRTIWEDDLKLWRYCDIERRCYNVLDYVASKNV